MYYQSNALPYTKVNTLVTYQWYDWYDPWYYHVVLRLMMQLELEVLPTALPHRYVQEYRTEFGMVS